MSERRRNVLVLLVVLGLIVASVAVIADEADEARTRPPGRRPARLRGAARPSSSRTSRRTASTARSTSCASASTRSASPSRSCSARASDQIDVSLPGVDERRARRAPGRHDGPDVLLRLGAEHPRRGLPDQPGVGQRRPAADQRPLQRRQAGVEVRRGRGRQQHPRRALLRVRQELEPADQRRHPRGEPRGPRGGPRGAEPDGAGEDPQGPRGRRRPARRGRAPARAAGPGRDRPVVDRSSTTRCSAAPTSRTRSRTSRTAPAAPPIVTMDFSDQGRRAFADTTRAIAQRGADNAVLNGGLQDPIAASHHFAIRLDNELISTPYINFRENPDGIDGSQGAQISGGFTVQTAQDLARLLKIGALPLKLDLDLALAGLRDARPAGARPGPRRRPRGLRDRGDLPARLLPRDGRDRRRGAVHLRALPARADQADPGHADAAGHRGPDPHDRRRGRREHRHLRTRQRGDTPRPVDLGRHRAGLQEGLRDDRRRQHRHAARRVHPLHPRDRGRQGLRVRARSSARWSRCSPPCSRRRRSCCRCADRGCCGGRPRWAPGRSASRSRSTSWARRGGSSRCPASSCSPARWRSAPTG